MIMKFNSALLYICLAVSTSCHSGKKHFSELQKSADTIRIQPATRDSLNFPTAKKKAVFNNNEPFRIIHSSRGITDQSSAKDTGDCNGWTISNKALAKIIKNSRSISGTEWDLGFSVLPCIIKGQLIQNGNGFDFEVNGGSWFYLKSADTTLIFGNFKKEDEKYFIVKPAKE